MEKIKSFLRNSKFPIKYSIVDNHIILDVLEEDWHYWSPQMSFRIEENEFNGDTDLHGLVGPRPAVWTLFSFIYFGTGTIGFFIFCYGAAQWNLSGDYNHFLLALPMTFIFMLSAFITSKIGENKGREQINLLKKVLFESIQSLEKNT